MHGARQYPGSVHLLIMELTRWLLLLLTELKATSLLEWIGVGFGVAEVLLARTNKIALYPCGIISIIITLYIYYASGLYGEVALNGYYLIMSAYGWWHWVRRKDEAAVEVAYASKCERWLAVTIVLVAFTVLYFSLKNLTDSEVPFWDAVVSATAWAGMWLLARRRIENWILLNISNLIAIPLLLYKGHPLYALLTLFLFIVACFGYVQWKKIIEKKYEAQRLATI